MTEGEHIELIMPDGARINVHRIRSRRKSMAIKILSDGEVRLHTPIVCKTETIRGFLLEKAGWIALHVDRCKKQHASIRKKYVSGEEHLHLGIPFPLDIRIDKTAKRPRLRHDEGFIVIVLPDDGMEVRPILESWYKNEARHVIVERVNHYALAMGVRYGQLRIKDQQTRWGSCSSKKNLNFNWHIIKAPLAVLDYIVVHELCHLVHLNHSSEFWNLVARILPDYEWRRDWLKTNGTYIRG